MVERQIRGGGKGQYNLNFIDWNNEWERVGEIQNQIENGEEVADKEEEKRVRRHMKIELNKHGVTIEKYKLIPPKNIPTNKECYICLKTFISSCKVRQLPCKHIFDEACLKPWLKQNSTCPTCKYNLKP